MVIAATQSVVVYREAVIGSEEVKRIVSLAELLRPFDDGLSYETSIEPTRRWSRPRWGTGVRFATPVRHYDVANNLICKDSNRRNFAESK